ncbi:oligosaccharide biosynthesis protein Alg14-like protein, partial [Dimargaris cristalligena]
GGHTAEMLRLIRWLDYQNIYRRRTYFVTDTDRASADKARNFEAQLNQADSSYTIETIPRSREVGQTWLSTPVSVARTFYTAFPLLYQKTPDLLLTNGPGSCVPLVTSCLLLQVFGLKAPSIIYVESFARVKSLSLTGRLLYPLVDRFIVQWPGLIDRFPRAEYHGCLV